jgi:transposase
LVDLKVKRQQLLSFLLRHSRNFPGKGNWTKTHARWLATQKFSHPVQQIVFQDQIETINAAQVRLTALEQQLREIVHHEDPIGLCRRLGGPRTYQSA